MTAYQEPHHESEHKKTLLHEMKACVEDMKAYQTAAKNAQKEGNETLFKELEEKMEKASQQHSIAKTEYVDLFGTAGL